MTAPRDYREWCKRYGDDYTDERQRRRAYLDYRQAHAALLDPPRPTPDTP